MSAQHSEHDYIIIGSGAAGGVIAYRLALKGHRVLLLEAGGADEDPAIARLEVTSLFEIWRPDHDWGLATEVDPGLGGRSMPILQGRVLGGGTSVNGRIFLRGNRKDYDYWGYLGNEGWSYEEVLPYFRKLEDYEGGSSEYRGAGGPLHIRDLINPTQAATTFVEAAVERGFQGMPWDFNSGQQEGAAGFTQSNTTKDGRRGSTAEVFIRPLLDRENFRLELGALATRVLIEGGRAVGVEYRQGAELKVARAGAEVIVSAGALSTPKLLMLSGVGPAEQLREHGISVACDLPGVGRNLQDHVLVPMGYAAKQEQTTPSIICEATLFTHTRGDRSTASPNLQFFFGGFVFPDVGPTTQGFTICPVVNQAHSVGQVSLRSADPDDRPVVQMNYFQAEHDMKVMLEGMRIAEDIVHAPAFDSLRAQRLRPGPEVRTKQEQIDFVRATAITDWHPSCSCKMGHDAMAVVDPRLRVHGVEGLRVADSSVMPHIVNCNINSTCLMIGEKAADMILRARVVADS
ncbi:MAG: GMC family oxidoreductase N-terminal domain-containing protein [Myxococcota bacterium]